MPSLMVVIMNHVLVNIGITASIHISVGICCEVVETTVIDPSRKCSVSHSASILIVSLIVDC
jgi:hypothetical protein